MNKYQEAMSSIIFTMHYRVKPKYLGHAEDENLDLMYELAEKAIPKKLVATRHTRRCPSCNRQLSDINNVHPNMKFCPNCGQALDWEDKKENVRNQEAE